MTAFIQMTQTHDGYQICEIILEIFPLSCLCDLSLNPFYLLTSVLRRKGLLPSSLLLSSLTL